MKKSIATLLMLTSLSSFADQILKVSIVTQKSEGTYSPCRDARPEVQVDDTVYIKDIPHRSGQFEIKISDRARKITVRDDNRDISGCTDYILETSNGTKHIQILGIRVKL